MSRLILPDSVRLNQEREQMAERHAALYWFDRQLRDIDPLLSLVKATDNAQAPGMVPGAWHVRRQNPAPALDSYMVIADPDGTPCDPSSGWLDRFRADDAWTNGGWREMEKRWNERERARVREAERQRDGRVWELAGRIQAKESPGVSFSDQKWTYRQGARDGR